MFSQYIKIPSLQNIYVFITVLVLPFFVWVGLAWFDIISANVFVFGLAGWAVIYQPLISGMRRNLVNYQKLMDARLQMQELTFEYISRELHDNINTHLIAARTHLYLSNKSNGQEEDKNVIAAMNLLTQSIEDVSALSKSLNLDRYRDTPLYMIISDEIDRLQLRKLMEVTLKVTNEPVSLGPERSMQVYRSIQAAISNIIKHAQAKNVLIYLKYFGDFLKVTITDDGKGFNYKPDEVSGSSAGIRNMRGRTKAMSGKFELKSAPDEGTTIIIKVRYKELRNSLFHSLWKKN